jgi:hypothetical protein
MLALKKTSPSTVGSRMTFDQGRTWTWSGPPVRGLPAARAARQSTPSPWTARRGPARATAPRESDAWHMVEARRFRAWCRARHAPGPGLVRGKTGPGRQSQRRRPGQSAKFAILLTMGSATDWSATFHGASLGA